MANPSIVSLSKKSDQGSNVGCRKRREKKILRNVRQRDRTKEGDEEKVGRAERKSERSGTKWQTC